MNALSKFGNPSYGEVLKQNKPIIFKINVHETVDSTVKLSGAQPDKQILHEVVLGKGF